MSEPAPPLAFDDVVIDFAGRRLLRGGQPQALEPKAFGVLALLAQAPGRVFPRDDILDAVWGHRHVTPGVLNRVMTLLRHALGEDAQSPRYLHTLHGVGYRFDLPPDAALAEPRIEAPPPAAPETPGGHVVHVLEPPRRRTTDARIAIRQGRRPWPLAVAALALAAIGILSWQRDAAVPVPVAHPAMQATPPALVVLPLKAIGGDESVRTIADGLSEELIGSLARIDGLRVIARESTNLASAESTDPAMLAKRLGISHSLQGSLQQAGQSLRIRLRLIDAATGRMLWAKDFDRDASEVLVLQREIAEAVAASLTLKLGLADAPKKSGDAEFLQRYLAARGLLDSGTFMNTLEKAEKAESEFRALLRERQDDARSHAGLATALTSRAIHTPALAPVLREEILHEAGIARRLDPSLPEPYVLLAREACARNAWERCLGLLAEAARVAPSDARVLVGYQFILARLGYLDRAETTVRELRMRDPISLRANLTLGRLLDTQGRHEEARVELEHTGPRGAYARWFNAVWRGDHAAALRIAETQIGQAARDDTNASALAPSYIAASRALLEPALWPQALAEFEKFEGQASFWNFSRVLAPGASAHAAEFIRKLDEVRQRDYSSWDLLLWTKDLAYLRRDPAFQAYLKGSGILDYWKKHGFPAQCRPQGDGAHCD